MLNIRATQFAHLDTLSWESWVERHAAVMSELLPDITSMYERVPWRDLIESLLRRAEAHAMVMQSETIAYCYGSLSLGVGFESRRDFPWAVDALAKRGEARADALWDGFEAAADTSAQDQDGFE